MNLKKTSDMTCICGCKEIVTTYDIGFNIDTDGEERQHVDVCKKCKAWRFHTDFIDFKEQNPNSTKYFGPWVESNDDGYEFIEQCPVSMPK